jgi:hypothetical protein
VAYLFPPMDDEPPPDFLAFVAARLDGLRREASRLSGGAADSEALTMEVLTDLAGHWRRLRWESRLRGHEVMSGYLARRLDTRTKQWREEQIYPVEVTVSPPPAARVRYERRAGASVARRLADLLPSTVRREAEVVAEAGIAWVHAYRRHVWWRYTRVCIGIVLLFGYLIQFMSQASGAT